MPSRHGAGPAGPAGAEPGAPTAAAAAAATAPVSAASCAATMFWLSAAAQSRSGSHVAVSTASAGGELSQTAAGASFFFITM